MKKAELLNKKLKSLINRDEPSSRQDDCKDALKSKKAIDKEVAIQNYNKWIRS